MKKVLSLVLVIAMILSSFSFAFAAKFEDVEGDYEEAINALAALGVVRGYEDGTFRPDNILTRAELAVLLVEALGYGDLVAGSSSNFSDTQNHWSNGYVGLASGMGLVLGYPDGTFKPDQPVSYDEAITMILRAVGYVDSALKGTWPTNFKVKAIDLKLLDGVKMASAMADRGGVAQILYNALELDMMELGEENVLVKAGRLFIDNIATPDNITVQPKHVDPEHKDYLGDIVDLEPYMYQNLDVYLNDDDEVVYIKGSNSIVITGTVDSVDSVNTTDGAFVVKDEAGKKHTIYFADKIARLPMFYNGDEVENISISDVKKSFEKITVVGFEDEDNDDSNFDDKINAPKELVGLVVREQTAAKKIANVYRAGRTALDGIALPKDGSDVDLDKVVVKGAVDAIEDIEKDDVVVAYAAQGTPPAKVELVVSRDTVEGKVTRAGSDYAYIGGTKYNLNEKSGYSANIGDKGIFYLDHNGEIVADKATKAEPTDYAIVIAAASGTAISDGRFDEEYEIDEYPAIKLATQDNEVVIYDVYVEVDEDNGDVEKSATYIETDGDEYDLIVTASAFEAVTLDFDVELTPGTIIKYILNDDDQIETIEFVDFETLSGVDTTKSTFKLAEGAVIFDKRDGEDYAVVKESMLKDTIAGRFVYNDDGELEVIVTADIKDDADDAVYAWVEDIEYAYNDDDDKVQVATVYMDGEEEELYTDDDDVFKAAGPGVFKLELDGNVITKATLQSPVSKTVSAVSTKNNMVQFEGSAAWFAIADNATMITLDDGEFDEFVDIFDVAEGDTLNYVLNGDGDIAFFELVIGGAPVK